MQNETHELMFVEEVAETCRAPVGTVRHWLRDGRLKSFRLGRRRLVRRADLNTFLRAALNGHSEAKS
jgi:excisionase family DNA binding protein